jgi:transcriptional regulator with XRE-family HTH domain
MSDIQKRFGATVARLRKEQKLSQEAFADQAGLHRTYVSGIERGARNPTLTVVERVSAGLGISMGKLMDAVDFGK